MRADRTVRVAVLGGMIFGFAGVLAAQAPPNSVGAGAIAPVLDEVKLIAQRAALPQLTGEKPFILRESSWNGEIGPGRAKLIQVQLFKRNDYQFWLAVPDRAAGVDLNLYDGKGELLKTSEHRYDTGNVVSLVVTPSETGVYYLRISLRTTVENPQRWTVIYGYR